MIFRLKIPAYLRSHQVCSVCLGLALTVFVCAGEAQEAAQPSPGVNGSSPTSSVTATGAANKASGQERVTVVLKTSVTSKSSHEGAEIKATTRKPVTLAGGEFLPRGSLIVGHVVQVSQHGKAKPNGAMLLTFDRARDKNGASIPVLVTILALADSADAANETVALPGVRVGGAANSGGTAILSQDLNDHTRGLYSNVKQSGLNGVFLKEAQGGSGVVFAAGEDVFLDSGIQMVIQIALAPLAGH